MTTSNSNESIWAQKYRPTTLQDCILPENILSTLQENVKGKNCPHFLFHGTPGGGKTTAAYCIAKDLGADVMYINASLENGIDVLRTKIQSFASTVSLVDDCPKIVILDEADGLTPTIQGALKGFLEAFSSNCRFIFTCNLKNKIIDPLHSRCVVVDFTFKAADKTKLSAKFFKRIMEILRIEGYEESVNQKTLAKLIGLKYPDFRKTLNQVQINTINGVLSRSPDEAGLEVDGNACVLELFNKLRGKDFTAVRKWVSQNEDIEPATIFSSIYKLAAASEKTQPTALAEMVLVLADYGYKSAFCADQQINTTACMVELMGRCEF